MQPVVRTLPFFLGFGLCLGAGLGAQQRPLLEASAWAGYTAFTDNPALTGKASGTGIRSVEVALWPAADLRLFGRYENTLSLDNLTLIRAGQRVPLYQGGALLNWGGRYTSVAQVGTRTLPGGIRQRLIGLEQVFYSGNGLALKLGGEVDPRGDQRTEWLAHGGLSVPLSARLRIEPTFFYARSGLPGESQWRALLAGEARLGSAFALGGGVAAGHNRSFDGLFSGGIFDSFARLSAPLGGLNRVHLLLRHERAAGASPITTIAVGLSLGLPRP